MATQCTTAQTYRYRLVLFCCLIVLCGGCKTRKIKQADTAHQAERYAEAADRYRKLYQETSRKERERKAFFAFRAAHNYHRMRQLQRAAGLYRQALQYHYPDSIVLLRLAQVHQQLGTSREALRYLQRFETTYPNDYFAHLTRQNIRLQDTLRSNPYHYRVQRARPLNSAKSDFGGAFAPDGSVFYFASARSRNPEIESSTITGEKPNDLYAIRKDAQGNWSRPDSVAGGVNSLNDEGMPALSPDGNTLYYTYAEPAELYSRTAQIYKSNRAGEGGWSAGTLVPIWQDSLRMAAHPALSASGDRLYFVSEGGLGQKDLYYIETDRIGEAIPTNLGAVINTPGNEISPTLQGDSTLYFASDGHPGLGGYDLYRAQMRADGSWECHHLGAPLNSKEDDYALSFNPQPTPQHTAEGYFSSSRQDALGHPHLWQFAQPKIITLLEGFVTNHEGEPIAGAFVRVVSETQPETPQVVTTHADGYFSIDLIPNTKYLLLAGATDYLRAYAAFATEASDQDAFYNIDFALASAVNKEVFEDIYYDFDRATLRPESQATLNAIAQILQDNPTITISLTAHADRKGAEAYNQTLSEARAQAAVGYLISKGIAPERLTPKGVGFTEPRVISAALHKRYPYLPEGAILSPEYIATLAPEEQTIADALNRRTEFQVIAGAPPAGDPLEHSALEEEQQPSL